MRILTIFLLFSLLTSCKPSGKDSVPEKALRLAISEDPSTLDPRKGGDALSIHLHMMLFEGLVKLRPDGSTGPAQSISHTVSSDGTVYTFSLGDTYWSDGEPVTASDFIRAWTAILSPDFPSPNAHLLYCIRNAKSAKLGLVSPDRIGIHSPDPKTLIVELEQPTPYFLALISFPIFAPHPSRSQEFEEGTITNGPFMVTKRIRNNELVLEKNPRYEDLSSSRVPAVRFFVVSEESTALHMYEKGEIDLIGSPFFSPGTDVLAYAPEQEIITSPVAATTYIVFNTGAFPFSDKRLRQAFAMALNREEIAPRQSEYEQKAAFSLIPPCMIGEEKKRFPPDNRPEEARKLFHEALSDLGISVKDLESRICYSYGPSRSDHKLAQILQRQWKTVLGVTIPLCPKERKILMDALTRKQFDFAQTSYRAQYFDPMSILERFMNKESGKNYSDWEHPKYIALLKESALQSGKKRMETLETAENLLMEEMPCSPLVHLQLHYLKKPHLGNIELSPSGGIFFERLSWDGP